jgi:hypothetical protein
MNTVTEGTSGYRIMMWDKQWLDEWSRNEGKRLEYSSSRFELNIRKVAKFSGMKGGNIYK